MYDQNLDTFFWAEASRAAVYIQNRCPLSHLDNKTLKEFLPAYIRYKPFKDI